jgi:hypothetical protein
VPCRAWSYAWSFDNLQWCHQLVVVVLLLLLPVQDMSPEELRHQDYGIGALALDLAAVFSCSAAFRKGSTTTAPAAAATPAPTTSGTSAAATAAVASAVAAAATAAGAAASAVAALSTLVGDAAASAMPVAGFTGGPCAAGGLVVSKGVLSETHSAQQCLLLPPLAAQWLCCAT